MSKTATTLPKLSLKQRELLQQNTAERARFARAIARSEFGRYNWDDRSESELRAAKNSAEKYSLRFDYADAAWPHQLSTGKNPHTFHQPLFPDFFRSATLREFWLL